MFYKLFLIVLIFVKCVISANYQPKDANQRITQNNPLSPYVKCSYLPIDFLDCEEIVDHKGNKTAKGMNVFMLKKTTI